MKQKKKTTRVFSVTLDIDPEYQSLVDGANKAGLKVITDYVRLIFAEERRSQRVLKRLTK